MGKRFNDSLTCNRRLCITSSGRVLLRLIFVRLRDGWDRWKQADILYHFLSALWPSLGARFRNNQNFVNRPTCTRKFAPGGLQTRYKHVRKRLSCMRTHESNLKISWQNGSCIVEPFSTEVHLTLSLCHRLTLKN